MIRLIFQITSLTMFLMGMLFVPINELSSVRLLVAATFFMVLAIDEKLRENK